MADEPYKSLGDAGESELVVERSRFMGRACPVASVDEALALVADLRREHYDARHVCFGLRVGVGARAIDRSHDDGEPARTGGFPLWQLLDGDAITDALIAVVRYYGGVKLGTGGLARAYRDTGREALQAAGVITIYPQVRLDVVVAYDTVGKLEHLLEGLIAVHVADITYAADVTFHLNVRCIALDAVRQRLALLLQRPPDSFEPERLLPA